MNTVAHLVAHLVVLGALMSVAARGGGAPDIGAVPRDLVTPAMIEGAPAPGKRVRVTLPEYEGTDVHHALYLPRTGAGDGPTR